MGWKILLAEKDGCTARPDMRDAHRLTALTDIGHSLSVVQDILVTATRLCGEPSIFSQALLVDWATTAPEFSLEQVKPDAWRIVASVMEAWKTGASHSSAVGFLYISAR